MDFFALLLVLICVANDAFAQPASMLDEVGNDAPERLIGIQRGESLTTLRLQTKRSTAYRDAYGWRTPYADGTVFSYTQLSAAVSHGFSTSATLYLVVPFVFTDLRSAQGEHARIAALGDVRAGIIFRLLSSQTTETGIRIELKSPSGLEWPGPEHSLLTGTGATNLALHVLEAARPLPGMRVDLEAGYVAKFPAIVGYVTEVDGYGHGWIDPGDELQAHLTLGFQLTPSLSAQVGSEFSQHMATTTGSSTPGPNGLSLWWVPGTGGTFIDAMAGFVLSVDDWEAEVEVGRDIAGPDSRIFSVLGLEELSPQPGWFASLAVTRRW